MTLGIPLTRPGRGPYIGPVPVSAPPYDDELPRPTGTGGPLLRPLPVRRLHGPAVVTVPQVPGWSHEPDVGIRRTPASDLPPPRPFAQVVATALVEVLAGVRPVDQLRTHCAPDVFAGIQQRRRSPGPTLPRVIRIRVDEPAESVAEVAAVVRQGHRVLAMAFRLQGLDKRWRVTDLQLD